LRAARFSSIFRRSDHRHRQSATINQAIVVAGSAIDRAIVVAGSAINRAIVVENNQHRDRRSTRRQSIVSVADAGRAAAPSRLRAIAAG
jgi:hypothetical protein